LARAPSRLPKASGKTVNVARAAKVRFVIVAMLTSKMIEESYPEHQR
jgi:hypothetical protein